MSLKVNENIVIRKIGEDMVLVPVGPTIDSVRSIYKLNSTAAFVLNSVKEGLAQDKIEENILNEFDVENTEDLSGWITEIIKDLRTHEIIL